MVFKLLDEDNISVPIKEFDFNDVSDAWEYQPQNGERVVININWRITDKWHIFIGVFILLVSLLFKNARFDTWLLSIYIMFLMLTIFYKLSDDDVYNSINEKE